MSITIIMNKTKILQNSKFYKRVNLTLNSV